MRRPIMSTFHSVSGWHAVFLKDGDQPSLGLTPVSGWGLVASFFQQSVSSVAAECVPLSFGAEPLSERPGYLGVLAPGEDATEKFGPVLAALAKPVCAASDEAPEACDVIS